MNESAEPLAARRWPVVVVGAGAAGFVAAIFAARSGARAVILETRPRPGAKIRVSGGGRCNILPSEVHLDDFHTAGSAPAMRNVLFSWPLAEVREFFERDLRLPLRLEAATGKLFPASERALDVVAALEAEAARCEVVVAGSFRVTELRPLAPSGTGFELLGDRGERVSAERLILSTGGMSLPKTGSDGGGLRIAAALGHELAPAYPALVPLLAAEEGWRDLAGVSLPARLRAVRRAEVLEERERELLFTHRGFSGPVVLDMSRHLTAPGSDGVELRARWGGVAAPDWEALLRQGGARSVQGLVREHLPRRLADRLCARAGIGFDDRVATLGRESRRRLVEHLEDFPLPVAGSEGYATAEVTGGGVKLSDLHLRTLESRRVPGLHFAGEILDVTGRIGGYNFLWAWVSGRRAGEGAGRRALPGP